MLSDEFANDFNCPKDTPMNPITQCDQFEKSVWPEVSLPANPESTSTENPLLTQPSGTCYGLTILI